MLQELAGSPRSMREQLRQACPDADAADVEAVLSDFQLALDRFGLILDHKTRCWRTLPWKLALVADPEEDKARQHTQEILKEFDEHGYGGLQQHIDTQALAHRLTLHYLTPGAAVREALEGFLAGGERLADSVLVQLCAQFVFMPTAERVIEAEHSIIAKRAIHRKVTGAYIALHLRLPEICKMLEGSDSQGFSLSCHLDL